MAKRRVGTLDVEIAARLDKLEASLRKAEGAVKKSAKKMEQAVEKSNPFSKMASAATTVLASMAALELGAKSLTAITKGLKGNFTGVLDTLETMPAGIGPAIAAMTEFMDVLSDGAITFLRTMDEAIKKSEKLGMNARKNVQDRKAFARGMQGELEMARLEPGSMAAKELAIEQKFEKRALAGPKSAEITRILDELKAIELKRLRMEQAGKQSMPSLDVSVPAIGGGGGGGGTAGSSVMSPSSGIGIIGRRILKGVEKDDKKISLLESIELNTRGSMLA